MNLCIGTDMTSRTRGFFAATLVVMGVLLQACGAVRVGVDHELGVRFDRYQTYSWDTPDGLPVGDPRLDNNPFFDSRVRAAVELELAAKGLRLVSESPDLVVHYHASVRQRIAILPRDAERGNVPVPERPSSDLLEFDEGTLIIDIAEANAKRILWRGWAQTDVSGLIDNPREMEKRVRESVRKMISQLPKN